MGREHPSEHHRRVRSGPTFSRGRSAPSGRLAAGSRADAGCRDQEEVLVTGERWKHAMIEKGELSLDADYGFSHG